MEKAGGTALLGTTGGGGLRVLFLLWPFLRPYWPLMLRAAAALLVAGTTVLVIIGGLRFVIDQGFVAGDAHRLNLTLFYLLLAIITLAVATFWRYASVTMLGEQVVADLRRQMMAHILKLSPAFFEVNRTGDILSRIGADAAILQTLIGSSLSVALRNCVLLLGGFFMMLITSAKLTGLVVLVIPIVIIPIAIFGKRVRHLSRAAQEKWADVNAGAEEAIYGIRTIQAYVHEDKSRVENDLSITSALHAARNFVRIRAWLTAIVITLVFTAIGVVLWIGGHDVLTHAITPGQLSAFVGYAVIAASSTGAISEAMGDFNRAAAATERIFDLLNATVDIKAPQQPKSLPALPRELSFQNVTFSYPSRPDTPVLKNVSFKINPGERVAIVGPSGAGKTTLFQLALRFYDPQQGSVLINALDIRTLVPQELRAAIGLVPQDTTIFSTDAARNISFGRTDAPLDAIKNAARMAHADEFIENLPQGYATYLGEKGVQLSGGQKQRIAIARAILCDPGLLLLDEATSALDAESERLVQGALDHLMRGRTTLIIAHRLSTIMNADRILVMEDGQIAEEGTHETLVSSGGLYARLAKLQFHA